jgi:hypothetical protein
VADIYIPTYGRVARQETLAAFPDRWRSRTALVCRPEEAADLYARYGVEVLVAHRARGISATRQWIIDQHEGDRLLMFDDDLKFAFRRADDPTKFMRLEPGHDLISIMLDMLWEQMDYYPVVGLASRGGANRDTAPWRFNQRIWDVMGLRMDVLRDEGFRYRMPLMEDFDLHLQFLTQGYPSAMLNKFTKDDFGSNAPGGCSTYRDATMQHAASVDLTLEWPEFVSLRETKNDWGNGMEARMDVRVQWGKAFKAGLEWRRASGLPLWEDEVGLL